MADSLWSRIKKSPDTLPWACAVSLPMLFMICWQTRNQSYYPDDSGRYMGIMSRAYEHARSAGPFFGMVSAYRQLLEHYPAGSMIGPVLGTPFALLAGGKILTAVAWFNGVCFLAFLSYVYLLAKNFVSRSSAAITSTLVGSVPYIFSTTHVFMPELPLLMCTAGVFYHLYKAEFFSNRLHSLIAAFWLALAVCVRPAESGLLFVGPFLCCVAIGARNGRLGGRDFVAAIVLLTSSLAGLSLAILIRHPFGWTDFLLDTLPPLAISVACYRYRARLRLSSPFIDAFVLCQILISLWLIPLAAPFWDWVWNDSFGARVQHQSIALSVAQEIWTRLMGLPFLALASIALVGLLLPRRTKGPSRSFLWVMALSQLLLISGFFAYNADLRYRYVPVFILEFLAVLLALSSTVSLPRLRQAALCVICLYQLGTIGRAVCGTTPPDDQSPESKYFRAPTVVSPQTEIIEALQKVLPPGKHALGIISPYNGSLFNFYTEPDVLSMVIRSKGLDWIVEKSPQIEIKDFLVVGPQDFSVFHGMPVNAGWEWTEKLSSELQVAAKNGNLAKYGLSYFGEIPVSFGTSYKSSYLILRNDRRR